MKQAHLLGAANGNHHRWQGETLDYLCECLNPAITLKDHATMPVDEDLLLKDHHAAYRPFIHAEKDCSPGTNPYRPRKYSSEESADSFGRIDRFETVEHLWMRGKLLTLWIKDL